MPNKERIERKIVKYLSILAIISLLIFAYRIYKVQDYSLENNLYSMHEKAYCDVAIPTFLIFSPDVPTLYYYSHGLSFMLSLLTGLLLFWVNKKSRKSKLFLTMMIFFCTWLILDLIQWATADPVLMLFLWGVTILLEVLFFGTALLIAKDSDKTEEDNPRKFPVVVGLMSILAIGIILFAPSKFGLVGVNMEICEVIEGVISRYLIYIYELLCLIFIIYFAFKNKKDKLPRNRNFDRIFLLSITLFLMLFFVGNLYGSLSEDWVPSQYGLIGMPIFTLFLGYLIQRFNFFNAKIFLTRFLILTLLGFTIASLFLRRIESVRIVVVISVVFISATGVILNKAVKKEIEQKEELGKLNNNLKGLLRQRESLVHLITHKVKGSFTHSKYIFAGILDGTFGEASDEIKKVAQMGLDSDIAGVETVDLVLNASNLERGTIKFDFQKIDFKKLVEEGIESKRKLISKKGLELETILPDGEFMIQGDIFWMKEVINNLIDNSLHYTPKGKIIIGIEKRDTKLIFSVKDTGIGITPEDMANLFKEGGRGKESVKINVDSTGYGLYSVKLIVEGHGGKVWAESEGKDKGSSFLVELNLI